MDPVADEQLDYDDEDYGASQQLQYQGSGTIPALAEEEDDDYEDLYDGVNVGENFFQYHRSEAPATSKIGNGGVQTQTFNNPEVRRDGGLSQSQVSFGVASDVRYQNSGVSFPKDKVGAEIKAPEVGSTNHISESLVPDKTTNKATSESMAYQSPASMIQKAGISVPEIGKGTHSIVGGPSRAQEMSNNQMVLNANVNMQRNMTNDNIIRPQMENGPTMLYVGELHWWTTDEDLERVLSQYGKVKELKFFDERASGKSKGYCQVEFYDGAAAAACVEGMNGYMFNGRACVVTFASAQSLKKMGASYANKNPQQPQPQPQGRRNVSEGVGRGGGLNYPAGDGGRTYGRGGWRGGGQNGPGRGPGGGTSRGRGGFMGPKNSVVNAAGMGGGPVGNFSQGLAGAGFGGPAGGMVPPQAMMGPGFDPMYMGRGAGYGGFSGPGFPGMMPPFPNVNPMGFTGVAPHVNPAFFGRGMAPNVMGMMGTGIEGHPGGMWTDPGMSGWAGEEQGQRTRESSYGGDDGGSDYGYGEGNLEKSARTTAPPLEKERPSERDRSGNSERRYRDERGQDWDRSDREHRYREDKDGYRDHRYKDHDSGYDDDWDRGQSSSRSKSRSRAMPEDRNRSRSRDVDYGKRRRAPSE